MIREKRGFRPKPTEYLGDLACGEINIRQQVAILAETEIVDMVRWHGDLPYRA